MSMNVLRISTFKFTYYLRHPSKFFKEIGWALRAAYMRIKYGYCYQDIWNWQNWFIQIIPPMFRYLSEHGVGYPGVEPFDTPEKWQAWLKHIADEIEKCSEEYVDSQNEYYKEWMEKINLPDNNKELSQKYFDRCLELNNESQARIQNTLTEIGKYFYWIWD